jgi:NodT family efflux transporter outer membrane factor (OMF) lipoprotein
MRLPRRLAGYLILSSTLASCSLAPDYLTPKTPEVEQYKELKPADGWAVANPSSAVYPRGEWWHVFNDPILDALEAEVTDANQNLKASLASYEQARAAVDAAGSALLPLVQSSASSTRERESVNRPLFSQGNSPVEYSDHIVSVDATYEIDVWGRLRNTLAAASESEQANEADLETLNLTLHADLASDYIQLRAQDVLVHIYAETIQAYKDALTLTRQRFDSGIASGLDVAQAEAQLQTAEAQSQAVALARAKLEHAIALLVGEPASTFSLAPGIFYPNPPAIPQGMPSELLQRRPDIAAAEKRVEAANSEIGVAEAAFYPDFQFDLSGGLESGKISNWIEAPSRFWSIGPAGSLTLFDAGEREAILSEASESYNQSVAQYRQTVLTAYQDVEDALASIRLLDQEAVAEEGAVKAAQKELDYANQRYSNGLAEYLDVVTAQTTLLTAQQSQANILSDRLTARVALIQALGGGWGPMPAPTPPDPDPASLQNIEQPDSVFNLLHPTFW